VIREPSGWVTDFDGACTDALSAGAPVLSSVMFAPVSSNAVVFRFVGLAQPGEVAMELTK
jgi:hypothetical protein